MGRLIALSLLLVGCTTEQLVAPTPLPLRLTPCAPLADTRWSPGGWLEANPDGDVGPCASAFAITPLRCSSTEQDAFYGWLYHQADGWNATDLVAYRRCVEREGGP